VNQKEVHQKVLEKHLSALSMYYPISCEQFLCKLDFFHSQLHFPKFLGFIQAEKLGVETDQSKLWAAFRILLSVLKAISFASNFVRDSYIQKHKKFTVKWIKRRFIKKYFMEKHLSVMFYPTSREQFLCKLEFFHPQFHFGNSLASFKQKKMWVSSFYFLYFEQLITLTVL
jgi:hypothetical protein